MIYAELFQPENLLGHFIVSSIYLVGVTKAKYVQSDDTNTDI